MPDTTAQFTQPGCLVEMTNQTVFVLKRGINNLPNSCFFVYSLTLIAKWLKILDFPAFQQEPVTAILQIPCCVFNLK